MICSNHVPKYMPQIMYQACTKICLKHVPKSLRCASSISHDLQNINICLYPYAKDSPRYDSRHIQKYPRHTSNHVDKHTFHHEETLMHHISNNHTFLNLSINIRAPSSKPFHRSMTHTFSTCGY